MFNRRTLFLLTGAAGLLAGSSLVGCGGGGGSSTLVGINPSNPRQETRVNYGTLVLTLRTRQTFYAVGEPVPFVFTITNTGPETVTYQRLGPLVPPGSEVDVVIARVFSGTEQIWMRTEVTESNFPNPVYVSFAPGQTREYQFS
jgi:hypothetical protein